MHCITTWLQATAQQRSGSMPGVSGEPCLSRDVKRRRKAMEEALTPAAETGQSPSRLTKPVVALVLPLILLAPYWWFVFHFARDSICTPRIGKGHQGVHLFFFWTLTFFPFAAVCFLSSVIMLARRARQDSRARVLLLLACLCAFGAVVLLVLFMFA